MVNSRKLLLLVVAIAVVAVSAFAQPTGTVACTGTSTPTQLRSGGITELTGDLVLVCTPQPLGVGSFTTTITVAVQGSLGNVITSRANKIFAQVDTANAPVVTSQVVIGAVSTVAATSNIIEFDNVAVPADTTSTIRISNIRIVAPIVNSTATTTTVNDLVSFINLPGERTFTVGGLGSSTVQVGTVYPSLTVSVVDCAKEAVALSFQQCIAHPLNAKAADFQVGFSENLGIANAFKNQAEESGHPSAAPASVTDPADTGTRFVINFKNIPAGVTLLVSSRELSDSTVGATAQLVEDALADGTKGTSPDGPIAGAPGVCDGSSDAQPITFVEAVDAGPDPSGNGENWYAVYEVVSDNQGSLDNLFFGVQVQYDASAGLPAPTSVNGTVTGNYAPLTSSTKSLPRFQTSGQDTGVAFSINACTTTLLFPYVTDSDSWDAGLAFTNASADDAVAKRSSAGACTLNFFGTNAPEKKLVPAADATVNTIAPGTTATTQLSLIAPGFTGYIVARCNFQYGHGLAILFQPTFNGAPGALFGPSSAYLALVIPDRTAAKIRPADPFTTAGAGAGEILGQ